MTTIRSEIPLFEPQKKQPTLETETLSLFEEYQSTLKEAVPNLGDVVRLADQEERIWEVKQYLSKDRKMYGLGLNKVLKRPNESTQTVVISESPLQNRATGLKLYSPEEILSFAKSKMEELLAPIRATNEARKLGQPQE